MTQKHSPTKSFIAGAVGGIGVVVSGHPLDTVKVYLQNENSKSRLLDIFGRIYREEGIKGYYKGLTAPLMGVTPLIATSFWGYSVGKSLFIEKEYGLKYHEYFTAGMISGLFTTPIIVPFDRIKCILQTQEQISKKGAFELLQKIIRNEGIFGLYRGTLATLLRDSPGSGVFYASYEFYVRNLPNLSTNKKEKPALNIIVAGGLAGTTFWLYGIIPDVLKTRHQLSAYKEYKGLSDLAINMIKNEGFRSLFKGISPALLRSFPTNGVCFLCYEYTLTFLDSYFPNL